VSGREDRKVQEVVVAEYGYRHEAEFAAGFLEDAEIPYRLQLDDPGMGMLIFAPARLWVRGMDASRAREILNVSNAIVATPDRAPVRQAGDGRPRPSNLLTGRERLLSAVGAGGLNWWAWYVLETTGNETTARVIVIGAILLAVAAIAGRAPRFLKSVLAAISGRAP
jgi:hypothetical protein